MTFTFVVAIVAVTSAFYSSFEVVFSNVTGESQHSLSRQFRLGHSTVNDLNPERCAAIYDALEEDFVKRTRTEEDWLHASDMFREKWQFLNIVGAMDGKTCLHSETATLEINLF